LFYSYFRSLFAEGKAHGAKGRVHKAERIAQKAKLKKIAPHGGLLSKLTVID